LLKVSISLAPLFFGTAAVALGTAVLVLARDLGSFPAAVLAAVTSGIVIGTADWSTFRLLWSLQPFRRSEQD
jgi:MFS superfamily sulfate permease-like transporter